ncbi:MAG TPA: hypothetical protein VFP37_00665 [Steroidobacteraceae bacterium]|nr:hypothetical protein [Steroidobacteraceae bacterium]
MSAVAALAAALLRPADRTTETTPEILMAASPARTPESTGAAVRMRLTVQSNVRDSLMTAVALERALAAADPGKRDLVLQRSLAAWIREEPQAAARFAELQPDPFLREVAMRVVAQRWARMDREALVSWAVSLADPNERNQVIEDAALAIADADTLAALSLLESHDGAPWRADTVRAGVIASWANRDFGAAQAWVEAQPPGPSRDVIVERLVYLRARRDPPAAMQLASQLITSELTRREAIASVIQPWMSLDPDAVRAWAASADLATHRRADREIALAALATPSGAARPQGRAAGNSRIER